MRRWFLASLLVAALAAQSEPPLVFEAASVRQRIRPENSSLRRPHFNSGAISCDEPARTELFDCGISGTRFSDSPASLLDLILDAYNVRAYTITGLPDWADSGHDLFDVTARIPADQTPTLDHARRMLQTLLADRFHLKIHRETKQLPVYDLVVTNKSKLTKSDKPCSPTGYASPDGTVPVPDRWEQIPDRLARNADRPVIDKTGLDPETRYCIPGRYPDPSTLIMLTLHPPLPAPPTSREDVASAINELESTSGLKLIPRKEPIEILVIDHAERPTPN